MPRVDEIIQAVKANEGFDIDIFTPDSAKPAYANKIIDGDKYSIRTSDDVTTIVWIGQFSKLYPGVKAGIKKGDGSYHHGQTKLGTVRG